MDNSPTMSDFIAIKDGKIIKLFRKSTEFDEECIIAEFSGLFKLSFYAVKKIIQTYEKLEMRHSGKFHYADSLKKAKIIDLLQELFENKETPTKNKTPHRIKTHPIIFSKPSI